MQKIFRSYRAATPPAQLPTDEVAKTLRSPGFLKPEVLVRYLGKMDSITQQELEIQWEGKEVVKAFSFAKTLTLRLAFRFFLGTDDPQFIARLVGSFDDITMGMHSIPVNFPGACMLEIYISN